MSPNMNDDAFRTAARATVQTCMAVKTGETLVVVADDGTTEIGRALAAAARDAGAEAILTLMAPRRVNGEEPPAPVAALMRTCQVLLMPTTVSLSHTRARKEAGEAGVRAASMPGVTAEMIVRTMNVDYGDVAAATKRLADRLASVKYFHLTTPSGTDMHIDVTGRAFAADTGLYHSPGAFGNLPAGEVCVGPVVATSEGVAVFDGSFAGVGLLRSPIRVTFTQGFATEVEGGDEAARLRAILAEFGTAAEILAELGIGTHPTARVTGAVLEDEKVRGTVHLAVGNNLGFGGTNDVSLHLDGVILKPTLVTDAGDAVVADGVLRL